jgi:hypothetical protein
MQMKKIFLLFLFLTSVSSFSQEDTIDGLEASPKKEKPSIDLYKIYTLEKDTTFLDTTLSLQKEYKFNMLRKDIFGLLPFANEGQTYNTLNFALINNATFPNFGFKAKHFNYLEVDDIKYYSVPTPMTDLYFKTVMEQGQSLDAFLTINTKPNLNFSLAYKGIRSLGKYINNLSSSGNFRFTTSYFTKDKRYILNAHFTGQDILNQENGGITTNSDFESSVAPYNERAQLDVYFRDAKSLLKGNRFLIDQSFKLSKTNANSLVFSHQFNQEYKFFEFNQRTVSPRFGNSFSNSIYNKTRYNHFYNKLGVAYKTKDFGNVEFFVDDNIYNYYYSSVVYNSFGNIAVPNAINDRINNIGGTYTYFAKNIVAKLLVSNAISDQSISNIEANATYILNDYYNFSFEYQKLNSLPALNYTLFQSNYVDYNWYNNFKNEKLNQFKISANTKWIDLSFNYKIINDHLYFENETNDITFLKVKPKQFENTLNYISFQVKKEIKFGKFALDNTVLYQNVDQSSNVINVPQIVTRNTIYFTDKIFNKAMQIQTGITLNYFTEYYANDYNPLLAEFYIQNQTKIGGFPTLDVFINAKVRQTRIFLKAEHFNSSFTGYNFYAAPNYPYRDFIIRFGLVWNFFQ